ncbi:MAG: NAD(P)-binding domain-containing protein [Gemmatimonadaceae bacterium]
MLLGHPVSHSLSPLFQNAALKSAGLQATYDALDVTPESLGGVLRELARAGVAGNITIPHKEAMAAACVRTTELASRVGAVNTFWHEKGKLVGDNTDVVGARVAIAALLDAQRTADRESDLSTSTSDSPSPLRVTILGAGGAAAAVIVALESFAPVEITISARTPERAQALAKRLGVGLTVVEDPTTAVRDANLVINCTPIGLRNADMPVAVEALSPRAIVFDLIPRSGDTAWVLAARASGHVAEDGTRMLIEQGAAAFERWFDMVPDRASMWRSLKPKTEQGAAQRNANSKPANRLA